MSTLLERAKAETPTPSGSEKYRTPEMIDLALAWARGEISMSAAKRAIKAADSTKTYTMLAHALAEHVLRNTAPGISTLPTGSPQKSREPGATDSAGNSGNGTPQRTDKVPSVGRAAFLRRQERDTV